MFCSCDFIYFSLKHILSVVISNIMAGSAQQIYVTFAGIGKKLENNPL